MQQYDINRLKNIARNKEKENEAFRNFLTSIKGTEIDRQCKKLHREIAPSIDCCQCNNCCRTLMINVNKEEAARLSQRLKLSNEAFTKSYLEKGLGEKMIINTMPCHFLQKDGACKIYEDRFLGCREFPALDKPGIGSRLFTVFMHYDRCPIVFEVIENLKLRLGFINQGKAYYD